MKAGAEEDPWAWVHICPFKQIHLREAITALPSGVRKGNHRDPFPSPAPHLSFLVAATTDTAIVTASAGDKRVSVSAKVWGDALSHRVSPESRACHPRRSGHRLAEAGDSHCPVYITHLVWLPPNNAIQTVSTVTLALLIVGQVLPLRPVQGPASGLFAAAHKAVASPDPNSTRGCWSPCSGDFSHLILALAGCSGSMTHPSVGSSCLSCLRLIWHPSFLMTGKDH